MSPSRRATAMWNLSLPMQRAMSPMRLYHAGPEERRIGPREAPLLRSVRSMRAVAGLPPTSSTDPRFLATIATIVTAGRLAERNSRRYCWIAGDDGRGDFAGLVQKPTMVFK